ncbi:MAG TPA: hypothetical protein VG815_03580 [Chloroflexota bacterium]|nr:hypothetical protein [Chloroflexota bacterium]
MKHFKRMWRELFKLAGFDYGRKNGLTWYTIRHELVSSLLLAIAFLTFLRR